MYQLINDTAVKHLPTGTVFPIPAVESFGHDYAAWLAAGNTPEPAPVTPAPTQRQLDENRYLKRAAVQGALLSWMAADNMSRVRSGVWTRDELVSLMDDPSIKASKDYTGLLSFELAAQAIATATHPLMTAEIKAAWVAKLTEHFYLVP